MRYMMIWKPADPSKVEGGISPSQEMMIGMGKFIEELAKSGALLMTDGLQSSSKGARVRLSGGKFTVIDGPFTETKELIGGFAILRLNSKAEAIELTKRFLSIAGEGESEIRLMPDEPAYAR